jgi:phosphatidyl-myo-inositol dimannoside synthase
VSAPRPQGIHITGIFPELLGVGGVQEAGRLSVLAANDIVRRRGWSASFTSLNDPSGEQRIAVSGCSVSFQSFARSKAQFIRDSVGKARAAYNCRAHIVLAGHPNLAPIAVWMQKMSPRARAIVMAHGIEVWQPLALVRRATIRHARIVTAPSSDTIQKLAEVQRVESAKTRLLPWPLNPDFLQLAGASKFAAPSGFPQGKVILSIGRLAASEQYKGTDNLIRAVAQLRAVHPDLHFVHIGSGDDLARLQNLAKELGVADCVHFLKGFSREELADCYAHADIFAMPSAGEGFGLVYLEAMAFGKPLVAAAAGGALDLVQDGVNGLLVQARDLASLASALARLLEDACLRQKLGQRGAALVREKYRFESFVSNLEQIFDDCLMDS